MLNQKPDKNQVSRDYPQKAKKSLGQNFLVDKNIITFIVNQLEIKPGNTIIEIGPGHGELTEQFIGYSLKFLEEGKKPIKIIAIEKDEGLVSQLHEKFQTNIEIIEGDALKMLPELSYKLKTINYKLIGNIPYYITGHLLRIIGELEHKPELIILTIQKEVAERIVATPPKMNLLSASVQFWGKPEILKVIDKKKFNPVPKVDSAVIRIATSDKRLVNSENFYKLIKILFKQPRKTILNNLKQGEILSTSEVVNIQITDNKQITTEKILKILKKHGIDPSLRPQNLDIDEIKKLANINDLRGR